MTYKEIVDKIREITFAHYMLKDFGYGDLSDIKSRSQTNPTATGTVGEYDPKQASYPYLFLNAVPGARNNQVITYRFNMIVMDVVNGEGDDYLARQSECQQYIDDVLAQLWLYYTGPNDIFPVLSNVTLSPFKERFQDELAGFTAAIEIQIKKPLNDCIVPVNRP